ncbi:hypothetical protein [Pseudomonas monteilii]|uniref:hypothetical protein n=1 Tax=Pseudomonas monteilii TaxID=76759 RepID=UPI001377B3A3|nr:hypothetical protein [Pseudomonas monteilii]NBB07916.1 hypothetical protein [Pseudomonas monteilii]
MSYRYSKSVPWISEEERSLYRFDDIVQVKDIVDLRNEIDSHFGSMISPEYVRKRNWEVGVISCNDEAAEDIFLDRLFSVLVENFKEHAYALPARDFSRDEWNKVAEIERFSPALIAYFYLSNENIQIVRRGMIPVYGEVYFIIPESRGFCYLNVNGEYHMIGSCREVLIKSFGEDYASQWKKAIAISGIGSSSEADMTRAARSYGY